MLALHNVGKSYGRRSVFKAFSHQFRGGLTLVRGPSGAGKSTLLRLIATAESPSGGHMSWGDAKLPQGNKSLRMVLGYAPQAVDLPEGLTARQFAMHIAALKKLHLNEADAQFAAITTRIGLAADVDRPIATFSGGMRRRLIFAQALLGTPKLLVLDEPTSELDRESVEHVRELIGEFARNAIVVMTTHQESDWDRTAADTLEVNDGSVRLL